MCIRDSEMSLKKQRCRRSLEVIKSGYNQLTCQKWEKVSGPGSKRR